MSDTTGGDAAAPAPHDAQSQFDPRVMLALIMVLVATLGAIAAYRTATGDQEFAELSQWLAEGQLVATAERQKLLDGTLAVALLGDDLRRYETAGNTYAERAATLRERDPRAAAVLDFKAQEAFAAARALRPFLRLKNSVFEDKMDLEGSLQFKLARRLANMGFPVEWRDPANGTDAVPVEAGAQAWESGRIWASFSARIAAQRELVPKLALCVVGFVAALAIFSCADLARKPRRWWFFLYAGLVVALASLAATAWLDPDALRAFAIALAAAAALFLLARWLGLLAPPDERGHPFHPPRLDLHSFAGEHLQGGHAADGFTRLVIGAVALTAFCSALAGYGYSRAEAEATAAESRASADAFELVTRASRLGTLINDLIATVAAEAEGRARRAVIAQASAAVELRGNEALLAADAARVERIARSVKDRGDVAKRFDDEVVGQAADPRFPVRLVLEEPLRKLANNAWEPFALWDAERGDVVLHHHVATAFLRTLTLFAIALYLFGQGFGMGKGRPAYLLVTCGAAFVAVGIFWGVRAEFAPSTATAVAGRAPWCRLDDTDPNGPPLTPRERAARHYALAQAAYSVADDGPAYARALPDLQCAVLLRPDFAAANRDFGATLEAARSSESSSRYMSLTDPDRMPMALGVRKQAMTALVERGFDVPMSLSDSFGFDTYMLALADGRPDDLPLAERTLQDALATARKAPTLFDADTIAMAGFNLGVVQLARGEVDAARTTYAATRDVAPRPGDDVLSGALTDLEALVGRCNGIADAQRCDRIRREAQDLKTLIVGGSRADAPPHPAGSMDLDVSPAAVKFALRFDDFQPARDELVVIWYAWDPDWKSWHVLQDVSGKVERERISKRSDGVHQATLSLLGASGGLACLADGSYRAEAYVNGWQVAASPPFDLRSSKFAATRLPRLNLQLCRPEEWKRAQITHQDELVEGFGVTYERGGYDWTAFLFATHLPLSDREAAGPERAADSHTLDLLTGKRFIPEGATVLPYRGNESCIASRPPGEWYWRAFTTTEGVRHLAVVAGDMLPGRALCDVLDSVENRYTPYLQATAAR
jgi:hypothetical protein